MVSMFILFKLSGVPTSSEGQLGIGELALLWGEIAGVGGPDFNPLFQHCSRYSAVYGPPYSAATFPQKCLFCASMIFWSFSLSMLPVSQLTLSCFDFAGDCLRPGVDPSAGFGRSGFPLILEGVLAESF